MASVGKTYEDILEESPGFNNPQCIEHLSQSIGLDTSVFYTNMSGLRGKYPNEEYATELRQSQASSWAFRYEIGNSMQTELECSLSFQHVFRSVAEGIEHFKEGRHSEAFQCLNKALTIDPRNVEGLVARGALYANNGSFKKAVDDFETALKINPSHANARKYMGETLVALGRSYEEDNRIDEAKKAYQDCLAIIPHHEEAQSSLNFLWSKGSAPTKLIEFNDLGLPGSFCHLLLSFCDSIMTKRPLFQLSIWKSTNRIEAKVPPVAAQSLPMHARRAAQRNRRKRNQRAENGIRRARRAVTAAIRAILVAEIRAAAAIRAPRLVRKYDSKYCFTWTSWIIQSITRLSPTNSLTHTHIHTPNYFCLQLNTAFACRNVIQALFLVLF